MSYINIIPFRELLNHHGKINFGELISNLIVFIPFGIYSGILLKKWSMEKKIFFFFSISFSIEFFQYILTIGISDITDLISNTLGGIVGIYLYRGIEKILGNYRKTQRLLNLIFFAGTVLIIGGIIYLKSQKQLMHYIFMFC